MPGFELTVLTMDRLVLRKQVVSAVIPAANGYLGVLPGHIPYLATLSEGDLSIRASDDQREPERVLRIRGGFMEVERDHVTIFADAIEGLVEGATDEPKTE